MGPLPDTPGPAPGCPLPATRPCPRVPSWVREAELPPPHPRGRRPSPTSSPAPLSALQMLQSPWQAGRRSPRPSRAETQDLALMCAPHPLSQPLCSPAAETSTRRAVGGTPPPSAAGPRPPVPVPAVPPEAPGLPPSPVLRLPSCREGFISSPGKTSPHPSLSPFPRSSHEVALSRHVSCVRRDPGAARTGCDMNPEVRFPQVTEGSAHCQPLEVWEPGPQPPVTSQEATSPF